MNKAVTPTALPPNWAAFVEQVTLGVDAADAARALGYESPRRAAAQLLAHPDVRKALAAAVEARLLSQAAPMALNVVEQILADPSCPASIRGKMAIAVLDRVKIKADDDKVGAKSLENMSLSELQQTIAQLEGAGVLAGQMRNVTPRDTPAEGHDTL